MNWKIGLILLLACGELAFMTGCVTQPVPAATVCVPQAPPPPQVEVIAPAPGPEYVWLNGHWGWNGGWTWAPGRWEPRPRAHASLVPGHWEHDRHGYVYHQHYWR